MTVQPSGDFVQVVCVKLESVQENKVLAELTFRVTQERAKVLQGRVEDLTQEVERLHTQVKELEGQASKSSQNSSKPPSSDGLKKLNKTTSLRVASGKKPGGQSGHAGMTLKRADIADAIVLQAFPDSCDAFEAKLPISETQVHQHGPNIWALTVHLTQDQLVPFARACELVQALYHLDISPATLLQWVHEGDQLLTPIVQAIVQKIQAVPVMNVDESGLRVQSCLQWLHAAATPTHAWYGVHPKRGMQAIQDHGILPNYVGILVHGCWAPYWSLNCDHSLCGAHLPRELIFQKKTHTQPWSQNIIDTLLAAQQACKAARAANTVLPATQIEGFAAQCRAHLQDAQAQNQPQPKKPGQRGRAKQSGAFNLLHRLLERKQQVLRFMCDLTVPVTNKLAERAIRMPKVKQRISDCFCTLLGADNFCVIRSYLDAARKQGFGMLHAMQAIFSGQPLALAQNCTVTINQP